MRSLYNKILSICSKKQSEKFLYFISFIESSVFPIPIVFLMIPVQLVKRHRAMAIGFFAMQELDIMCAASKEYHDIASV